MKVVKEKSLPLTTIGAALLVACGLLPLQASATLVLSSDGNVVYDTVNNISWLADANLAAKSRFCLPLCTGPGTQNCVNASGSMRYDSAVAWVQAMNAANYLGHNNWQLPTSPTNDINCGKTGPSGNDFGFGCTASAYGSVWNALGLMSPNTAVPVTSNTVGPFNNFQPYLYWSQSGASPSGGNLTFSFATGWQGANTLPNFLYALPMVPGKLPGSPPATGNSLQVNPGGQTVYDPVTNITWLANANLAASNTIGLPTCTDPTTPTLCVAPDGAMTFASASQFIANMNALGGIGYLGQTNWQLPTIDSSCPGYNCAGILNPMGNLFYGQLHFSQGMTVVTAPNIAVGPFHNIQPYLYWSCGASTIQGACDTNGPAPNFEWSFSFGSGFQGTDLLANDLYAMAYYPGSPTASPLSALVTVVSRKTHGTVCDFDLPIDTTQLITGNVTVEPREIGSGHAIVFQFNGPVSTAGNVSVTTGAATATFFGNEVLVNLTNVPETQRVTITLTNVNGSVNPSPVSLGFLVGDVNNTRSVNASDISGVKARSGQTATGANFKFDVNTSGAVNFSDISAVKARSGLVLP